MKEHQREYYLRNRKKGKCKIKQLHFPIFVQSAGIWILDSDFGPSAPESTAVP
jgi:hypothetical protein